MDNVFLFGSSGHGKVIKDILLASGTTVKAFIDDNPNINEFYGSEVLHDATGLSPIIVSIGACKIRQHVVNRLISTSKENSTKIEFAKAIHPNSIIAPTVEIGEGTVVMAGTIINADAVIGKHCIINTSASIDHECVIEDFCHIAPGVVISGNAHIGEGSWIGVGSCIIQGIRIGKNCFIGAGSVVVKDIPDNTVAYGNPCKVIKTED